MVDRAVRPIALPEDASLRVYQRDGHYADCYVTEIATSVSQADYIEAFYTTWLFKLERLILHLFVRRPSTDAEARALSRGERDRFAAWSVEQRDAEQLLMADFMGRTRSWLRATAIPGGTRLHFGSAVVPVVDHGGQPRLGTGFSALLGFHKLYSRALLASARIRLNRRARQATSPNSP